MICDEGDAYMKSKGFTLIELLAVIVILAIIALIATPIVLNVIKDYKKNSFIQTANGIIDAAEYYYANEILDGTKLKETKIFKFENEMIEIEFDGEKPKDGYVFIDKEGKIAAAISNGNYCITKNYEDDEIQINENPKGKCTVPYTLFGVSTTSASLGITEVNPCITRGEICENGTAFAIKVNDEKIYKFFVISDNGKEVELIMNSNLNKSMWISKEDYETLGGLNYNSPYGNNEKGPVTALETLKKLTNNWTNIKEREYTVIDDLGKKNYNIVINTRARMLTYTEAKSITSQNNNIMPKYLSHNGDYWLSSSRLNTTTNAHYIYSYEGLILANNVIASIGLRPVITITK